MSLGSISPTRLIKARLDVFFHGCLDIAGFKRPNRLHRMVNRPRCEEDNFIEFLRRKGLTILPLEVDLVLLTGQRMC